VLVALACETLTDGNPLQLARNQNKLTNCTAHNLANGPVSRASSEDSPRNQERRTHLPNLRCSTCNLPSSPAGFACETSDAWGLSSLQAVHEFELSSLYLFGGAAGGSVLLDGSKAQHF